MKLLSDAWLLAKKDLTVYVRDRAALCLGFLVPIALVTVFGWIMTYAFAGSGGIPRASLWYVDQDGSERSAKLIEALRNSTMVKLLPEATEKSITVEELRSKIADGDAHHGIVIPKGYGEPDSSGRMVDLLMLRDPGRVMEDRMIDIAILQSSMFGTPKGWSDTLTQWMEREGVEPERIGKVQSTLERIQGEFQEAFQGNANDLPKEVGKADTLQHDQPTPSKNATSPVTGPTKESSFDPLAHLSDLLPMKTEDITPPDRSKRVSYQQAQSVSGMSVMMLLFGLTGAGSLLIQEKDSGTLRRLFALPVARESVLLGKFFFVSILGMAQMIVLFTYGELMFRVGMFRDPGTLCLLVITWVAAASSFAMFIATFSKSAKQADSLATVLILVMAALGGCWFPLQMMELPTPMVWITRSMMTYWAMDGLQGMLWNSLSWMDWKILKSVGIQWLWATGLATLATYFFRKNYLPA